MLYFKKRVKQLLCIVLCCCITFGFWLVPVQATTTPSPGTAKGVILMEATTKTVLYEYQADEKLPIASVTKIMLLLLLAEEIAAGKASFEDEAITSAHANSMDGSVIWLDQGEKMSIGDLVKSVVIASANDACVVLAEYLAGSEKDFVERANRKAKELGMNNTHFVNSTGYDDENHYSTARDVAIMSAALMQYSYYDTFFLTRLDSVRTGTDRETQLLNTNKMITYYKGIRGIKTGTTDKAGNCFSACATRGDMTLIGVVLGCHEKQERFDVMENLLDYGFNEFEVYSPVFDRKMLSPVPVEKGIEKQVAVTVKNPGICVIPRGSASRIKYHYMLHDSVRAGVREDQRLGEVALTLDNKEIYRRDIVALREVEELTLFKSVEILFKWLIHY